VHAKTLVGKSEKKRPFERRRRRYNDNIKTDLKEVICEVVDRIHTAQGWAQWRALLITVMNLGFHKRRGIS
jgi:hypothetical protein